MLLRLAALGALGYAAYKYYDGNRGEIDRKLRRFAGSADEPGYDGPAGGPLSSNAMVVHPGEGPMA